MSSTTKRLFGAAVAMLPTLLLPVGSLAKPSVVATSPDLAAIAAAIAGDAADVRSIGKPNEDPHFVQPKPSLIVLLNKADLLIENGLGLESGWLPALVDQTRNGRIRPGGDGRVVAAAGVPLLEVPSEPVTRAMGDVHPGGNPHFLLDPERGKIVARNVFEGLGRVAPHARQDLQANLDALILRLDDATRSCRHAMEPYRGTKVVTYHKSLTYFCHRFGLLEVDTVEPKPGIPPSASHIASLIDRMEREEVSLILMEPWHERKTPGLLAEQTGAQLVEFPTQVGGATDMPGYPEVCGAIVERIVGALKRR